MRCLLFYDSGEDTLSNDSKTRSRAWCLRQGGQKYHVVCYTQIFPIDAARDNISRVYVRPCDGTCQHPKTEIPSDIWESAKEAIQALAEGQ